ncbi:hypothetical protein HUA74_04815 [Myxococcus sp. CA051A]|uniref:Lipoprotein n=1 Tax=Myxococcus llanfairpwllgwyngyllgogerychwyrndrobwllllantysiliogogogochensis TaxID=2590453 RepID=A0A540X0N2_9BACT|nr:MULTISPECIES: hypothetical protein [Myxococcus]NTX01349.1 hypothetical protein [Myxococcus sp. CA040A]NTX15625.1 hypothetical protein [Myxococcus sp. CA056]NTX32960.1 hypothetical protein [Myxococcus sp. CA033]NTX49944.1 hypothetical protein [Myxococcus sp. CA039A]NTX59976.1 hypothetical protein [Myxococcus sp. CA051A]
MGVLRKLAWGFLVVSAGCSGSRQAVKADAAQPGTGGSGQGQVEAMKASVSGPYVDEELGFEIIRPSDDWQLDATNERTPEGLAIPVVLRHPPSGAQVVLQVAPAVATPTQFAERLTEGLRQQPGFITTDPVPLALSDTAVGFNFQVGDNVHGRVAVREGQEGRVLMMLATWPAQAVAGDIQNVDALIAGIRPLPNRKAVPSKVPQAVRP